MTVAMVPPGTRARADTRPTSRRDHLAPSRAPESIGYDKTILTDDLTPRHTPENCGSLLAPDDPSPSVTSVTESRGAY